MTETPMPDTNSFNWVFYLGMVAILLGLVILLWYLVVRGLRRRRGNNNPDDRRRMSG